MGDRGPVRSAGVIGGRAEVNTSRAGEGDPGHQGGVRCPARAHAGGRLRVQTTAHTDRRRECAAVWLPRRPRGRIDTQTTARSYMRPDDRATNFTRSYRRPDDRTYDSARVSDSWSSELRYGCTSHASVDGAADVRSSGSPDDRACNCAVFSGARTSGTLHDRADVWGVG